MVVQYYSRVSFIRTRIIRISDSSILLAELKWFFMLFVHISWLWGLILQAQITRSAIFIRTSGDSGLLKKNHDFE